MGKCKTKVIQADLGIFTNIAAYLAIIRHIQESLRYIQAYSEPGHTQNCSIFRTLAYSERETYSEPQACSEPCQTSAMEHFAKTVFKGELRPKLHPFFMSDFC